MKKISVLVFILLFWLRGFSANYYFSTNTGNDTRTAAQAQNPNTPWKTLAKLSSVFSTFLPGDSILLKRGETYYGFIQVSKSGTSPSPIVIGAYGTGDKPIITSLVSVPFTTAGVSSVYTSDAVAALSNVSIIVQNGTELLPLGRYPNLSATDNGYLKYEAHTANSITDNSLLNTPNWTGAGIRLKNNEYTSDQKTILSHTGTLVTATTSWSAGATDGYYFFFNNSLQTLDTTGEWYYNPATKKTAIYSSTGTPTSVEATSLPYLLTSTNFSFITLDNLYFKGANDTAIKISGGSGFIIKNCTVNFSNTGIYTTGHNSFNFHDDSVFNSIGRAGIFINGSSNSFIRNCYIYKTQMAIGMGVDGGGYGNGIDVRGATTVEYNKIIKAGYCGIKFFSSDCKIHYNFVDSAMSVKNDGGGIYTVPFGTGTITGQEVIQNIVLHTFGATGSGANPQGAGVYVDNGASNIMIAGNTVAYSGFGRFTGAIYLHGGKNNIVRDNTCFDNVQGLYISENKPAEPMSGNSIKSNLFIGAAATQVVFSAITVITSPNNIPNWGAFDSNYYARPINDSLVCNTSMKNLNTPICLASWKTAYPAYDIHSLKSQVYAQNVNQIVLHYNATQSPSNVVLSGTWKDVRGTSYSGTITLQPFTSIVLISTGNLTTPTITWANPAAITYPAPLTGTQLNASTGIAGTFTYTPASGTVLNSGAGQSLSVLFTPTNGTLYTTASKTVTITVNKASATLTYSNLTQTYSGLPLAPTITTSPAGLTTVNTLYNGVGATPINANVYSIVSGLTNNNYSAPTINGTFTISKAGATLTVSNLAQTYDGSPKPITVVTNPVGLSGVSITYDGSSTPSTNAGTHTIVVTLNNQNYTATQVNTVLVIAKAMPTVSWATPSAITYGTALSGTQLNASASVAGTFTYTPASGTVLNAGTEVLSVNFTPTDATNYNSVNNTTVNLVVNKAVATITITPSTLNQTYDGNPKSVTVTTSPANLLVITVTYNGSTTPPSAVGTYPVIASLANSNYTATNATGNLVISTSAANIFITNLAQVYTGSPINVTVTSAYSYTLTYNGSGTAPTNVGSYQAIATINDGIHTGADTQILVISKANPSLTWSNPADILFGTALSGTELNASANVAGSFAYSPISGTVLNVGNGQILSTTFTPTDASNYNTISTTVSINVIGNTATLSLSGLTGVYDGNPHQVVVTTSPTGLSGITVLYDGSATVPTNAGSYTVNVTLVNSNYTANPVSGTLVISKINPVLTFAVPQPISAGTALSATQLNATANISGTFTYVPTFGDVPAAGTSFITATFTPTDSINYNTTSISVPLSVIGNPILNFYIRNGTIIYIELP